MADSSKRAKHEEEEEEEEEEVKPTTTTTTTSSEDDDAELELIQEEHRVWKKNSPYLYDMCLLHKNTSAGYLTCDWLPHKTAHKGFSSQEILLGTKSPSSSSSNNYLSVVKVLLPPDDEMEAAAEFNNDKNELANYAKQELSKFTPLCRMIHDGDVDRARLMPNNPFVIATRMGTSVGVFKFDSHPLKPRDSETTATPQILGLGHEQDGYGLDWNQRKPELLLTGGGDGAFVWNVDLNNAEMRPLKRYAGPVSDVAWDPHCADRFATVSLQGELAHVANIWDIKSNKPALMLKSFLNSGATSSSSGGDQEELNALAFNPEKPGLLLTAGSSKIIKLWDERKPDHAVHEFTGHMGEVYGLSWAPFNSEVFASAGGDRRVILWDVNRIGQDQTEEEKEDGPAEMVFIHGGHCGPVMDLAWNPNEDWLLASVSDDGDSGDLQIWRPADHCLGLDDEEDGDDDDDEDEDEEEGGDLE